jgi:beta-aspartyl-peptidase (threonine type)
MKKTILSLLLLSSLIFPLATNAQKGNFAGITQLQSPQNPKLGFMIHGGAGVIKRGSMTPEREKEYRDKLEEALLAGYKALQDGKTGVDAVEIAIKILEDSPLFNAGKGSVFTSDGRNELDASIMNGKTLAAGGVAGLHHVKNPISLARAVMEKSPHVLMFGDGAEVFAKQQNIELVDEKYFWTKSRWDSLQRTLQQEKEKQQAKPLEKKVSQRTDAPVMDEHKFGTVGAVALDKFGELSAGTSTGGIENKRYGRVGDSPIIGAGTYANTNTCGVSATGDGEYFIRLGVARDISALIEYRAMTVQAAADLVIKQKVTKLGGGGGVIVMDKFGNMGISFNTDGMFRAYINGEGKPVVLIYAD